MLNKLANAKISLNKLVILMYALYAIQGVWLAFSLKQYSSVLYFFWSFIVYASLPLGVQMFWKKKYVNRKNFSLLILPLTYWLFLLVHTFGGYSGDWLIALIAISCFCLFSNNLKRQIFECFFWIVLLNNIFSLFVWICYYLNIDIGFQEVIYYVDLVAGRTGAQVQRYYIKCGIIALFREGTFVRLCGIFNEPGGLGTICALLFIATFRYSKLWQKVILIIAGFFTYSLAFYLLIFMFVAFYLLRKNIRNIVWLGGFLAFFLIIPYIDWGNESLNIVAKRLEVTENGLAGDNRTTDELEVHYKEMKQTEKIWFGYGADHVYKNGGLSYKQFIIQFGIIGYSILLINWLVLGVIEAKKNKDALLLLFFFLISLYQRPEAIINLYGYVLLFGGFEYLHYSELSGKVGYCLSFRD